MASLAKSRTNTGPQLARRAERRDVNLDAEIRGATPRPGAIVRNVSATGLLIRSSASIPVGESIRVDLPHGGMTEATVVWAEGSLHGCEFARPITPGAMSAAILKSIPIEVADGVGADSKVESEAAADQGLNSGTKILIILGLALLCWLPLLGLVAVLS